MVTWGGGSCVTVKILYHELDKLKIFDVLRLIYLAPCV